VSGGWSGVPRIAVIPAPVLRKSYVRVVGEALERHLEVVIAIDDEWKDLIASGDDIDLTLKLRMRILDAVSGCKTEVGNVCPAVVLRRDDIRLLWLADDGGARFLSVKEMARRGRALYAEAEEPPEGVRLLRLQTFRPLEHGLFFDRQFENLEFEVHEALRGSRDVERWRRLTGASTLPGIAEAMARAARRHVVESCVFDEYNVCPGMLLLEHGGRVDVKILRISAKTENYIMQIDLAGLLADRRPPPLPASPGS
jgi:hypothetical protein